MLFAEIITAYNHNFPGIYAGENLLDIDIYFHNYNPSRSIFHYRGIDGDAIYRDHRMPELRIADSLRVFTRTTGDFARSTAILVRLKKSIFMNAIRDVSFVGKVAVAVLVLIISMYSALAGSGLFAALNLMARRDPSLLLPLTDLVLFFIFISNVLAVVFIGGSRVLLFDKLVYYPIETWKGVSMEITTGMLEPLNLVFLPLYFAACFLPKNPFTPATVLGTLLLVFLFFMFVSGISLIARITLTAIASSRRMRRLFAPFMFALTSVALVSVRLFGRYIPTRGHILAVSGVLDYFPSGAFVNGIFAIGSSHEVRYLSLAIVYLVWANLVAAWLSVRTAPALKRRMFSRSSPESRNGRRPFPGWVAPLRLSPLAKKNIIYALRSSRNMVRTPILLFFWVYLPAYFLLNSHRTGFSAFHGGAVLLLVYWIQTVVLISYSGSVFSNDYHGIVNYFIRPVGTAAILSSKRTVAGYMALLGGIMFFALAMLLKDDAISSIVLGTMMLLAGFALIETGLLLSVYFVKPVPFRFSAAVGQIDASAYSLIVSLPVAGAFGAAMFLMMNLNRNLPAQIAGMFAEVILGLLFLRFRARFENSIGHILFNRKERVIAKCR